jgi:hypothetical protein
MLKNDNKILDKIIIITFLALFCSFLSAIYISSVQTSAVNPSEIKQADSQPNAASFFGHIYS